MYMNIYICSNVRYGNIKMTKAKKQENKRKTKQKRENKRYFQNIPITY